MANALKIHGLIFHFKNTKDMAKVWVKGYTKKDGTKVPGHYRDKASSTEIVFGSGKDMVRHVVPTRKSKSYKNQLARNGWDISAITKMGRIGK